MPTPGTTTKIVLDGVSGQFHGGFHVLDTGDLPNTSTVPMFVLADLSHNPVDPTAPNSNVVAKFFTDSTANLTANAVFSGTDRDIGVAAGAGATFAYFNAFFLADQVSASNGAVIQGSVDGSTWVTLAAATLAVSVPTVLQVPVMFEHHRVQLTNGPTGQGSNVIHSSYTAA